MSATEQKVAITTRYSPEINQKIETAAEQKKCTKSDIIRNAVEVLLNEGDPRTEYIDVEQGQHIQRLVQDALTEISNIRIQLIRIGNNFNQEVKMLHLVEKYSHSPFIDVRALVNECGFALNECEGFSPKLMDELMERYENASRILAEGLLMYTSTNPSKSVVATLSYLRGNGRGHNGNEKRNMLVGSVGMMPDDMISFEKQMLTEWALRASNRNLNECRRVLASWSRNELDPDDPESPYKALEMSEEFVKKAYPDRIACIFIQGDGKSKLIHSHIVLAGADSINHKGFSRDETSYRYVETLFDQIASETITLDYGKGCKDKYSQNVRRLRDQAAEKGKDSSEDSWTDELKRRISIAMNFAVSMESFKAKLEELGIKLKVINKDKENASLSYSFEEPPEKFSDIPGLKVREGKLGEDFGMQRLREKIQENLQNELLVSDRPNVAYTDMEPKNQENYEAILDKFKIYSPENKNQSSSDNGSTSSANNTSEGLGQTATHKKMTAREKLFYLRDKKDRDDAINLYNRQYDNENYEFGPSR